MTDSLSSSSRPEGRRHWLRNVASNYLGFGAQSLVVLILTPMLIGRLGDLQFGLWVLLTSLLSYFQVLEFGLMQTVIRYVASSLGRQDREAAEAVASTTFAALLVIAALSVPLVAVAAWIGPAFLQFDGVAPRTVALGILLIGLAALGAYFRRFLFAVLEGCQQFLWLNLVSLCGTVLSGVASALLVVAGYGVLELIAVLVAQTVLEGCLLYLVQRRVIGLTISVRRARPEVFRSLIGYSSYAFVMDLAVALSHRVDALVISLFLPVSALTPYSIGNRMAHFIETFTDPMVDTFFPLASELDGAQRKFSLQRLLIHGTRVGMLVVVPGVVLIVAHGADLIRWWVGAEHVAATLPILHIFVAVVAVAVCEATASRLLLGIGRVRFDAIVSLCTATANLTLSCILVHTHGAVGVAIGTLIPATIGKLFVSIPFACSVAGLNPLRFYRHALAPALSLGVLGMGAVAVTESLVDDRVVAFVTNCGLQGLLWAAHMWWCFGQQFTAALRVRSGRGAVRPITATVEESALTSGRG